MKSSNTRVIRFVSLGDLICAVFDRAAETSKHPVVIAALATRCVDLILEELGHRDLKRVLAGTALALEKEPPRTLRFIGDIAPVR